MSVTDELDALEPRERARLTQIAREAAEGLAGKAAVQEVEVVTSTDSLYRPVYWFSFLIDKTRTSESLGHIHTRLMQALLDRLESDGDEHLPMVRILDHRDWQRRAVG